MPFWYAILFPNRGKYFLNWSIFRHIKYARVLASRRFLLAGYTHFWWTTCIQSNDTDQITEQKNYAFFVTSLYYTANNLFNPINKFGLVTVLSFSRFVFKLRKEGGTWRQGRIRIDVFQVFLFEFKIINYSLMWILWSSLSDPLW